ncbi:MAG: YbaN family protein [Parvibaculum sp.]|nr:YbaN family protein [Parvibaculum sp.]
MRRATMKAGFITLGCLMLLLGLIGAFLPVMPTTIFLIGATWCFGRSSPGLEAWMLDHPRFGPVIRNWRDYGAIPRRAKWMACGGMAVGYASFWLTAQPGVWLAIAVATFMIGSAAYVTTRPEGNEAA